MLEYNCKEQQGLLLLGVLRQIGYRGKRRVFLCQYGVFIINQSNSHIPTIPAAQGSGAYLIKGSPSAVQGVSVKVHELLCEVIGQA